MKDAVFLSARDRGMYFNYPGHPEFLAYTHWLATFRTLKNKGFLHRPVIIAEMLSHRAQNLEKAEAFWMAVFTETHPDPDHETRVLAEWFREQLAVAGKPKLDMGAFRRKTQRAWKLFQASLALTAA